MTVCSTTSSYVFSTRMNLAKSSKISSWNRGSSCQAGRRGRERGGQGRQSGRLWLSGPGTGPWPRGRGGLGLSGGRGALTDLQVGASFLSRNGIVICSNASRKKRFRTELLS